jgi:hypothetical protein
MAKILNFTGRIDIPVESFSERKLTIGTDEWYLDLAWDMSLFSLPSDSLVMLELAAIGTFETERINLGQIGDGILQSTRIPIRRFRNPELIQFRLKVVRASDAGIPLILAEIDKVKPILDLGFANRPSLLKRRKIAHLPVPWELQFEMGMPILCISGKKDMWFRLVKKAKWFEPISLHAILKEIFLWTVRESVDPEDPEVFEKWRSYFIELGATEEFFEENSNYLENDSESRRNVNEMCTTVMERFCIRFSIFDQIASITGEEVSA